MSEKKWLTSTLMEVCNLRAAKKTIPPTQYCTPNAEKNKTLILYNL